MSKIRIKKIVILCLIAFFTVNTISVAAMMVCHETTIAQAHALDTNVSVVNVSDKETPNTKSSNNMPCHEAENADMKPLSMTMPQIYVETDTTYDHSTQCHSFSCGHCPLLIQAALTHNVLNWSPSDPINYPPYDDIHVSAIAEGIDYPPKLRF